MYKFNGSLSGKNLDNIYVKKGAVFSNDIICLDVETSSGYLDNEGYVFAYDSKRYNTKEGKKIYIESEKVALLYEWTISINDWICYGRDIDTLKQALYLLTIYYKNTNIIVWAHNYAFEFMWLLNCIKNDKVFARAPHKVIYSEWGNVQFRCSYFLTRLSLEAWGEYVGTHKKIGNLDYSIQRTPLTELTKEELQYCEYDVRVMYDGLKKYLNKYKTLHNIPLTQTGEVRRVIKEKYTKNWKYHELMTKLLPRDAIEYKRLLDAFWGGSVGANILYINKLLKNVFSKDIQSSYPAVMALYKYPSTPWVKLKPDINLYNKLNDEEHSFIIDVEYKKIKVRGFNTYISKYKCKECVGAAVENGKIQEADKIRLTITNVDFDLINQIYENEGCVIHGLWMSRNAYLDIELILTVLEFYAKKTELKDIDKLYEIYMFAKQQLNSTFGMMVTKIIMQNILFTGTGWRADELTDEIINKGLNDKSNKVYENFLSYSQGLFITAYARRALWTVLLQIDNDVAYRDTDSLKYINEHEEVFEAYNNMIMDRINVVCVERDISRELMCPRDKNGIEHPLGIYTDDKGTPYKEFKTLGAKRYCVKKKDGKVEITVSGVSKKKGISHIKNIDKDFCFDTVFTEEETGKLILTYLYDMPECVWNKGKYDEFVSTQKYGVHAQNARYYMKFDKDFKRVLEAWLDRVF